MFGTCYLACMFAFLTIAIIFLILVGNKKKKLEKQKNEIISKLTETVDNSPNEDTGN